MIYQQKSIKINFESKYVFLNLQERQTEQSHIKPISKNQFNQSSQF